MGTAANVRAACHPIRGTQAQTLQSYRNPLTPTLTPSSIDAADKCRCSCNASRPPRKGPIPILNLPSRPSAGATQRVYVFTMAIILNAPPVGHIRPAITCIYA